MSCEPETRASIHGFISFFCGTPVIWKSKSYHCVTLSPTEAEHYAASEVAKDLIFISNIIKGMRDKNSLLIPMASRMDNTGAIYFANIQTTVTRTNMLTSELIMLAI